MTRHIPNEYKKVFEEYVLIRFLDTLSDNKYQELKKQTSKIKFIEILPKIFPNFNKMYDKYLLDFLGEIYGKN